MDLLKGLRGYGGLVSPNFQCLLAAKLCVGLSKVLQVQERACPLSPCRVCWDSDFTRRRGGQKRGVFCLSVCLSDIRRTLNIRVCAPDFAMKALEYKNNFDGVG